MKRISILFALLVACFVSVSQEVRPKLVVYSKGTESVDEIISNKLLKRKVVALRETVCDDGSLNPAQLKIVNNAIMYAAAISSDYTVLDHSSIDAVKSELTYMYSGAVDDADRAEKNIGKLQAAQYVIVTKASAYDKDLFITIQMINIETGEIINSQNGLCKADPKEIQKTCFEMSYKLLGIETPATPSPETQATQDTTTSAIRPPDTPTTQESNIPTTQLPDTPTMQDPDTPTTQGPDTQTTKKYNKKLNKRKKRKK